MAGEIRESDPGKTDDTVGTLSTATKEMCPTMNVVKGLCGVSGAFGDTVVRYG